MTYAEAWNKIVGYYEKHGTALETTIQTVWEDSVFSAILNYDTTEIDAQRAVQMGATKKADIVVRKDGKDVLVAELKRHIASVSDGGQAQLFSYLNQLKSVDIGILVCNKLYVYDFDFTKQDAENAENRLEIPFERDNPDGAKFVELFSKENFNAQNIKEFIRTKRKNAENNALILEEISETLVRATLKKYFMERFSEEDIESALDKIDISVSMKNRQPNAPAIKPHEFPVAAKKEVVAGYLEKHEIIDICRKNGILIDHKFTKAKLNAGAPRYWANPNKKFLKQTWWLALVNTDERKLHVFKIPENSIKPEQMKYKNKDLIDLQIYSDRDGFIDSRSGIYFLKWLVKTIAY